MSTYLHPRAANSSPCIRFGRHHGRDIDGACGQLAVKVVRGGDGCSGGSGGASNGGDIEDLVAGGRSKTNGSNGGSRGRLGRNTSGAKTGGRRKTRGLEDTVEITVEEGGDVLDGSGGWGRPVDRGTLLGGVVLVVGAAALAVVLVGRARRRG